MRTAVLAAAVVGLLAAAPAAAQNGAMWVDDHGRMTSYAFAGGSGMAPNAEARPTAELAGLFERVCLGGGAASAATDAAAKAAGLVAAPFTLPGSRKAPPVTLDLWTGPGLVVSRTDGFLGSRSRQCNATFYLPVLPPRDEHASAVAAALGRRRRTPTRRSGRTASPTNTGPPNGASPPPTDRGGSPPPI